MIKKIQNDAGVRIQFKPGLCEDGEPLLSDQCSTFGFQQPGFPHLQVHCVSFWNPFKYDVLPPHALPGFQRVRLYTAHLQTLDVTRVTSWVVIIQINNKNLLFPVKEFSFRTLKPLGIRSWLILSNFLWVLGCLITYQSCLFPLKIISVSFMAFWHLKVFSFECSLCSVGWVLSSFSPGKRGWRWREAVAPGIVLWCENAASSGSAGRKLFIASGCFLLLIWCLAPLSTDDGISSERVAQVMGLPDRCQHAAHIISELILTAQVGSGSAFWECRLHAGSWMEGWRPSSEKQQSSIFPW